MTKCKGFMFGLFSLWPAFVWAASGASIAPSKTYCPRAYPTAYSPSPPSYVCGSAGTLSNANVIGAYCGSDVLGLGSVDNLNNFGEFPVDEYTICYRACVKDSRCISFSVDAANQVCYTYGKTLLDMGYKANPNKYHYFYNLRGCHNCTQPPTPVQSSCPSTYTYRNPAPQNSTCGQVGHIRGINDYVFQILISSSQRASCYRLCVQYFDPVGLCESFAYLPIEDPFDGSGVCRIFNQSLADLGFKQGNGYGAAQAWSLRDCFECDAPTLTIPTCSPTTTPVNVGIRNGNFQRSYIDKNTSALMAYDWDPSNFSYEPSNAQLIQSPNGNKYFSLPAYQRVSNSNGDDNVGSRLVQYVYGVNQHGRGVSQFHNVTFDVAIPTQSGNKPRDTSPPCTLKFSMEGVYFDYDLTILANDPAYRGTTLKTAGPFLGEVDSTDGDRRATTFDAFCFTYDENVASNATFWVDNVRLTLNGRDVGLP